MVKFGNKLLDISDFGCGISVKIIRNLSAYKGRSELNDYGLEVHRFV